MDLESATGNLNSQTDTFYKFIKDVTSMHMDIARKYKKTVNSYMPKKKPGEEDSSLAIAFHEMLNSFNSMALVHEKISKDISENILVDFKKLQDDSLKLNQKQTKNRAGLYKHIDEGRKKIENSWLNYLNAYRNKQKAQEANLKAQADDALSRAEQSRYETAYRMKDKDYSDRELTYATDLKKYNDQRSKCYTGTLLNMITIIEEQESLRSTITHKAIEDLANKHKELFDELAQTTISTSDSAKMIDYEKDIQNVISKFKTDELFPVDLPFLSLDKCPANFLDGAVNQLYSYIVGLDEVIEKTPKHSTFGMSLFKKTPKQELVNLSNPFVNGLGQKNTRLTDLTVLQVYLKINEAKRILESTEKEIDASEKMITLYNSDPNLGDPETVKPRLMIIQRKHFSLDKLLKTLEERYESLGGDSARIRMEQKLDRAYSLGNDASADNPSIDSNSIYEFDSEDDTGNGSCSSNGQTNIPPPPPDSTVPEHVAIGYALYEYPGNGELYLPCQLNEMFYIVEKDTSNCGWTEIVSQKGKTGYVPTNFLKVEDV